MSRLIWSYAVCKSLLLSPVAVKDLNTLEICFNWRVVFVIAIKLHGFCSQLFDRNVRKRTSVHVRPAKNQISLRIRAVWKEPWLGAFWIPIMQSIFMRTTKTLIRLRGCAGWSESSLWAQVRRYKFVFSYVLSHENPSITFNFRCGNGLLG